MNFDLLLKGGHVIDPANGLDGLRDVAIHGGKVAAVDTDTSASTPKIAKLLGSEDWKQVRKGFELHRSLGDDISGGSLLGAIEKSHEQLAKSPQEIQIRVGAAETEKETVKYTAGAFIPTNPRIHETLPRLI